MIRSAQPRTEIGANEVFDCVVQWCKGRDQKIVRLEEYTAKPRSSSCLGSSISVVSEWCLWVEYFGGLGIGIRSRVTTCSIG
jgi:hypothetical protein